MNEEERGQDEQVEYNERCFLLFERIKISREEDRLGRLSWTHTYVAYHMGAGDSSPDPVVRRRRQRPGFCGEAKRCARPTSLRTPGFEPRRAAR